MRGTHRLGILAASIALLAIGAAVWLAGRRGESEVQDSSTSDALVVSTDAEILAALGISATSETEAATSIALEATPGEIRGVLLDDDGKPARGTIEVSGWYELSDAFRVRQCLSVDADAAGRFRLQPGKLAPPLWVRPQTTARHWGAGVQATPGGEPVVVRLRSRPTVRVTVLDPGGLPVEGARVGIFVPIAYDQFIPLTDAEVAAEATLSPRASEGKTDVRGVAVIAHPGAEVGCKLTAQCDRMDRDDVRTLVIKSWKPADCTVRLPASYVVEGTVRDGEGRPFEEGTLAYRTGDGDRWETVDIEYDGTFRIARLEGGSVELEARISDVVPPSSSSARVVAAGARDVLLTVELGAELVVQFAAFPEGVQGHRAYLTAEPWNHQSRPARAEVSAEGTCRFRGLRPGAAYTVYLPSHPELVRRTEEESVQQIAYRAHVTMADSPVRIELIDGLWIGGTLDGEAMPPALKEAAWAAHVRVQERGVFVDGLSTPDRFVVGGLPPGEWTLEAVYQRSDWVDGKPDNAYSTASAVVTAGRSDARLKLGAMKPGLGPVARGE